MKKEEEGGKYRKKLCRVSQWLTGEGGRRRHSWIEPSQRVPSDPTEQRNIDRLPVQKGYHALKCHHSLVFFPPRNATTQNKTKKRKYFAPQRQQLPFAGHCIAYEPRLHSGVYFDWQVDELPPLFPQSIWIVDRFKKCHIWNELFKPFSWLYLLFYCDQKRLCENCKILFCCCCCCCFSCKVNSHLGTWSRDVRYLNVVTSNKMMPLFQPVVLLRVWPHDIVLKAKDLLSAWFGNALWTEFPQWIGIPPLK